MQRHCLEGLGGTDTATCSAAGPQEGFTPTWFLRSRSLQWARDITRVPKTCLCHKGNSVNSCTAIKANRLNRRPVHHIAPADNRKNTGFRRHAGTAEIVTEPANAPASHWKEATLKMGQCDLFFYCPILFKFLT